MTLAELVEAVSEMARVSHKFNADPAKVEVFIYGEQGRPHKARLTGVLNGMSISMMLPVEESQKL